MGEFISALKMLGGGGKPKAPDASQPMDGAAQLSRLMEQGQISGNPNQNAMAQPATTFAPQLQEQYLNKPGTAMNFFSKLFQ